MPQFMSRYLEDGQDAEKVLALDAQAQTAGITALIGIGVFPGLTNLLAKHAAAQLEQVEELRVCIVLTIREPRQRLAAMRASGRISASWESMLAGGQRQPAHLSGGPLGGPGGSSHRGRGGDATRSLRDGVSHPVV